MNSHKQGTEGLVEAIEQRLERWLDPRVRNAFLRVPRHLFLDHVYRQQGDRLAWDYIARPTQEEIYRDEALVTKIDEQGRPLSSSSQPSVMALQLELLDLRPGLAVLEIGTGTGYNAALMGVLVSPAGQITSIDLDHELITAALQHLQAAGITNVLAMEADGFEGCREYAPYHRLLSTCAVRALPRSWSEQLALDGILLVNLRLNLSSVFLWLRKIKPTVLEGRFFDLNATYMEMQSSAGLPSSLQVNWKTYDSQLHQDIPLPVNLTELLARPAYSVLLECLVPSLRKKYRAFPGKDEVDTYLIDVSIPGTALRVQGDRVTIIGRQEYLKAQLLQSITWYERFHWTLDDYIVSFDETGAMLRLHELYFALEI